MGWLRAYVLTDRNFGFEMSRMIEGRGKVGYKWAGGISKKIMERIV